MTNQPQRATIGWREWVSLPTLGIAAIKAKTDTGARTSALHAYDLEQHGDVVRFKVHPLQKDVQKVIECSALVVDHREVRSSSGRVTRRPVIRTELELFGERWPIEVSLVSRDAMGFRMLLGRQAIRGRFIVDPSRSFLAGQTLESGS